MLKASFVLPSLFLKINIVSMQDRDRGCDELLEFSDMFFYLVLASAKG